MCQFPCQMDSKFLLCGFGILLHGFLFISGAFFPAAQVVLCHAVQTVSLAAHALSDTFAPLRLLVLHVLVLPSLVKVKSQACSIWHGFAGFGEHGTRHAHYWSVRSGVVDQITVVEIQDWRKIELLSKQARLRYVGEPLLFWPFCVEVPVQQVGSDLVYFPFVNSAVLSTCLCPRTLRSTA